MFNQLKEDLFHKSDKEQVAFTKEIIQIIKNKRVIDWIEKEDSKREMRSLIRRKLKAKGCPKDEIEPLIYGIMSLASNQLRDF